MPPPDEKRRAGISMAAHRVTAPAIAARTGLSLPAAQRCVREWQRRHQQRQAGALIADCMRRLGITGTGRDEDD